MPTFDRPYNPEAYHSVVEYLLDVVEGHRLNSESFEFGDRGLALYTEVSQRRYQAAIASFVGALETGELAEIISESCVDDPHLFLLDPLAAIAEYIDIGEAVEHDIREHFEAVAKQAQIDYQTEKDFLERENRK